MYFHYTAATTFQRAKEMEIHQEKEVQHLLIAFDEQLETSLTPDYGLLQQAEALIGQGSANDRACNPWQ
jgi:hypothetical protein